MRSNGRAFQPIHLYPFAPSVSGERQESRTIRNRLVIEVLAAASAVAAVDTTAATTLRSCSTPHEISQSCDYFHSRHGDSRYPGDGFDHPRPAEVDSRFSRRRDDGCGEVERAVRGGLCADAVFLFTLTRSFVRSIWKTAHHPALKSRSRFGLHRDGNGAHIELAFPWPNYFRNHDFKHSHRDGLYRRRYAEGKTSWSVWVDRRGIRRRIHVRTSNWWIGW